MQTILILVLCAVAAMFLWIILPHLWRRRGERRLAETCQKHRAIILSYDDGPEPETTAALADVLGQGGVPGSFFLLGHKARDQPELVTHLLEAGHEVGGHSQTHKNAWWSLPQTVIKDILDGQRTVDVVGGRRNLFRAPFGKFSLASLVLAWRQGFQLAYWTIDSKDVDARLPVSDVLSMIEAAGGGVILMHDLGERPDASGMANDTYVRTLTQAVIEFAKDRDFRIVTFGQLERLGPA